MSPGAVIVRIALLGIALLLDGSGAARAQTVIDGTAHHLGTAGEPEWKEFEGDEPEGRALELRFALPGDADVEEDAGESTMLIRQRDVKLRWDVRLNGRALGPLVPMEARLVHALAVPAGALRHGENILTIGPSPGTDDIVIEQVVLDLRPRHEALGRATLEAKVTDADSGTALPCRLTLVDDQGALAPLMVETGAALAARPGVVYTPNGRARVGLLPGRYSVSATRGFEYGLARQEVTLAEGQHVRLELAIRREVPTPGLVACDTHIHTLTHSGHGDATIEERVVTLAGEGIELPVATDHDHLTDLGPAALRLGVRHAFTPVIGCEVTTRAGHFNAFPFPADARPPDPSITDWPLLLRSIRQAPGEPVVVLNHPRDVHAGFRPFDPAQFNPVSGEHRRAPALGVDALEVINSGAMQTDPMQPLHDWMALLNRGERITAVAASDSHDVARFIVGQGRTYLACPDDDPAAIDVDEACRSLHAGRALVSLGLLVELSVEGRFGVGDLAGGLGKEIRVTARVLGPSWTTADRVALYADGIELRAHRIEPRPGAVVKSEVGWTLPRPEQDVYLVAIASGPGVVDPAWAIPRPYQPTSIDWEPRVLGVTNPVYVDADGDGSWTSPRGYAEAVVARVGTEPAVLLPALAPYDEAVAAQAAALCRAAGRDLSGAEFARGIESAAGPVRRGFVAFARTLAAFEVRP